MSKSSKKHSLRPELLELQRSVQKQRRSLQCGELLPFQDVCKAADDLVERISNPRDNSLSSYIFKDITDIGRERASGLGETEFTARDLVGRIWKRFGKDDGDMDWDGMWKMCKGFMKAKLGVVHMLGALGDRVKRRESQGRNVGRNAGKMVVEECVEASGKECVKGKENPKATDKLMEEMYGVLIREGYVPFPELVLNPCSFAQTVENVFALSFLVKDRRVKFHQDKEFGVVVSLAPKGQKRKHDGDGPAVRKKQCAQLAEKGKEVGDTTEDSFAYQTILTIDRSFFNAMKKIVLDDDCKMEPRRAKDEGPSSMMDIEVKHKKQI